MDKTAARVSRQKNNHSRHSHPGNAEDRYSLGRKRLLDTMLAAIMAKAGVTRIVTNNGHDYRGFARFEIVPFRGD